MTTPDEQDANFSPAKQDNSWSAGLVRLARRVPVWLYRLGLGRLFGHHFVYLVHRDPTTGARQQVVVDAVAHRDDPPSVRVVAGRDTYPDWYRSLLAAPALEVRIGPHHWPAPRHRQLSGPEILTTLHAYQRLHPMSWRRLGPLLGFPGTPDDPHWTEVADEVRAIVFTPNDG